jgi:ParB family chromosome partitioning protein
MPKKVGLPEFIKMKHDHHLVDEISLRTKTPVIRNIPIEKISTNQMQPRRDMGDLTELTDSIRENGIIEPVIVRPKDGNFEIIAGERRFRAAKEA